MKQEATEQYEMLYAVRRGIPVDWIRTNERLALAAFLEWEMISGVLSCYQARRKYVEEYPESNRLAVPRTIVEHYGYKTQDLNYAKGSVLEMIKPYENTERYIEE